MKHEPIDLSRHLIVKPGDRDMLTPDYISGLPEEAHCNKTSTDPFRAHEHQIKRSSSRTRTPTRAVIYHHPCGESFSIILTRNELAFCLDLVDAGGFITTNHFKRTKGESRKPVSVLRQLGIVIATIRGKTGEEGGMWALLGSFTFEPSLEDLEEVPTVTQWLPDIITSKHIHDGIKHFKRKRQDHNDAALFHALQKRLDEMNGEEGDDDAA